MTAVEKLLAQKSGKTSVHPGDVVYPDPDYIMIHDQVLIGAKRELDQLGIDRLAAPEKVMIVTDHEVIYASARGAERGVANRQAAAQWGVKRFYDVGQGGHGHIFPLESGMLLPGMFYFDNDRHATNAGAIGAFGFRVGAEISRVLATGTNWIKVPRSVRLTLRGRLASGVYGRDVGFKIAQLIHTGDLPFDLDYRVLEFAGDLDEFDLAQRVALCSSPTEMRAVGVFIPPNDAILRHAADRARWAFTPIYADSDANYEAEASLDIGAMKPQVVHPGAVHRSMDVVDAIGVRIDHAFIGSCGSGMYTDMEIAARVMRNRRVAPGVRLFVVPGSMDSAKRMAADGIAQIFLEAGAVLLPAGCGPCNDAVIGPLAPGEVSISTATANQPGRMGSKEARMYLASPATVAYSAVVGHISDPREVLH